MARYRSIKPEFWADEDLATELTRDQRLLYIGLWNFCHDNWTMEYKPRTIWRELFAFDADVTPDVVDQWVRAIAATGRIVFFEHEDQLCIWLPKCAEHQRIDKPQRSPIPAPSECSESVLGTVLEDSISCAGARVLSSPLPSTPSLDLTADALSEKPPPEYASLPDCLRDDRYFLNTPSGRKSPLSVAILEAFEAKFGMPAPADLGEFARHVRDGCLQGCPKTPEQAIWCADHICWKVEHKGRQSWRSSSILKRALLNDREDHST